MKPRTAEELRLFRIRGDGLLLEEGDQGDEPTAARRQEGNRRAGEGTNAETIGGGQDDGDEAWPCARSCM
jgi:hypothetical protein